MMLLQAKYARYIEHMVENQIQDVASRHGEVESQGATTASHVAIFLAGQRWVNIELCRPA